MVILVDDADRARSGRDRDPRPRHPRPGSVDEDGRGPGRVHPHGGVLRGGKRRQPEEESEEGGAAHESSRVAVR